MTMLLLARRQIGGGQVLTLWAERYSSVAGLADFGPWTSRGIDYSARGAGMPAEPTVTG